MKIYFDNVNLNSRSGPNSFGRKLKDSLIDKGHKVSVYPADLKEDFEVQLSFISSNISIAPVVQRLDGIYFNVAQDYQSLNSPIRKTYENASAVIFQSNFNKELTEKYFGKKEKSFVIHNGTNTLDIKNIEPIKNEILDNFSSVWCCASSWRPHKRLGENVRYFLESSSEDDCLVIAGSNPDYQISHPRIFYAGDLSWRDLVSLYKRSSKFIHLAWLDHCPNVVVDARAAGCQIVCSSTGGTREISGKDSIIIEEEKWDFSPTMLYSPPKMDFSKVIQNKDEIGVDIREVAEKYISAFKEVAR